MLMTEPSVQPLREWADEFSSRRGVIVPQFDPAEGGVDAKVLFLLEAPGPMTNAGNARPGSGFISVDNDDATAENMWLARDAAGLHDGVLAWNIVPWYLGVASVKPTSADRAAGADALRELLALLPYLEVIALTGQHAQNGWQKHLAAGYDGAATVVDIWHPSTQSLNQPGRRYAFNSSVKFIAGLVASN